MKTPSFSDGEITDMYSAVVRALEDEAVQSVALCEALDAGNPAKPAVLDYVRKYLEAKIAPRRIWPLGGKHREAAQAESVMKEGLGDYGPEVAELIRRSVDQEVTTQAILRLRSEPRSQGSYSGREDL